jgi:multidrug resistance efflux pump
LRRTAAGAILGVLVWWFLIPLLFPVTSQAVINARVVQVRTPIDGANVELAGEVGEQVSADRPLLCVVNERVDTSHVEQLKQQTSALRATARRLRLELEEVQGASPDMRSTSRRYQVAVRGVLKVAVREAAARCAAARIDLEAATKRKARVKPLARGNVAAAAEIEELSDAVMRARQNFEKEKAALARLEAELAAAEQGVYLQNEASYSQRRLDELDARVPVLRRGLRENADTLAALEQQTGAEQRRLALLGRARINSPVAGVVWKRPGNVGQMVKQHEVVYEIADASTLFVEALFHQRFLAGRLVPGARATVLLTSGKTLAGRVRAVRTLGGTGAEPTYAINLASRDLKQVRVLIEVEGEKDASLIGRHVRVLVTSEEPGLFERAVACLFTVVGA